MTTFLQNADNGHALRKVGWSTSYAAVCGCKRSVNVLRKTMQTAIMVSRMFTLARHLTKMNEFAHAGVAGQRLTP
ncbi:MAG TPA: hypothetical protein VJ376_16915 [Pseudomonadota bacterium]|nr:hypothetical protein [Pseudomonadota bacterium]